MSWNGAEAEVEEDAGAGNHTRWQSVMCVIRQKMYSVCVCVYVCAAMVCAVGASTYSSTFMDDPS